MDHAPTSRAALGALLCSILLGACGGGSRASSAADGDRETSGGEATGASAVAEHPIRTTVPIPVPQPAIAREQMSGELQRLWELVEQAVAIRPPDPPADGSIDAVNAWADGPFAAWLAQRAEASAAVQSALEPLSDAPAHERGVAAGLFAYLQEDMVADVRGAPIPEAIASDSELLRVYDESLLHALVPYAQAALQGYRFCDAAFTEGSAPEWASWAAYCRDRAADIETIYAAQPGRGASGDPSELRDPESAGPTS